MKHEHTLEVKVPSELQEKADRARISFQKNEKMCLLGLGIVIGAVGMRVFGTPTVKVIVITD